MSLQDTERVDAATTRDGWTVLTIHHFDDWQPLAEREDQLRKKLHTYERFINSSRYLIRFSERPVRIELSCIDAPPDEIRAICRRWSVRILEPASP